MGSSKRESFKYKLRLSLQCYQRPYTIYFCGRQRLNFTSLTGSDRVTMASSMDDMPAPLCYMANVGEKADKSGLFVYSTKEKQPSLTVETIHISCSSDAYSGHMPKDPPVRRNHYLQP